MRHSIQPVASKRSPDERSDIRGCGPPHFASLMAGYDTVLPHSIHPVASALAQTGSPFVRASSAIAMWS